MLFVIDTCQAASMYEKFYSPNVLAVASSLVGEDSLSVSIVPEFIFFKFLLFLPLLFFKLKIYIFQHHVDPAIGVYIIDRYTYYALDFLERVEPESSKQLQRLGEFVSIPLKKFLKKKT